MGRGFLAYDSYRLGIQNNVAVTTGASVASAAFGAQTYQIRICHNGASAINYKIGDGTPTAASTDTLLPPNWVELVTVTPGQKIAAIGLVITLNVNETTQ